MCKNCNINEIDAKCYIVKLIAWGFIQKQSPSIPAEPYRSFSSTEKFSIYKNGIRFRADPEATKRNDTLYYIATPDSETYAARGWTFDNVVSNVFD
jgi:hypothetical protein